MNAVLDHQADTDTDGAIELGECLTPEDRKIGECRCSQCDSLIPPQHIFIRLLRTGGRGLGQRSRKVSGYCGYCQLLHQSVQYRADGEWSGNATSITPDYRGTRAVLAALGDECHAAAIASATEGVLRESDDVRTLDAAIGRLNSQIHQLEQRRATVLGLTPEEIAALKDPPRETRIRWAKALVAEILEALTLCQDTAADSR